MRLALALLVLVLASCGGEQVDPAKALRAERLAQLEAQIDAAGRMLDDSHGSARLGWYDRLKSLQAERDALRSQR